MKKLVVVAPTFNEEENVKSFIEAVFAQKSRIKDYELHLLISDSHSKDKTAETVREFAQKNKKIHFFDTKIPGPGKLGSGLSEGLDYATTVLKADAFITMEADLSNDPNQIPQFIMKMKNANLVIGSRYSRGGKIVNWSWWRKCFSYGANYVLKALAWTTKTNEFTNLYRAFDKEVWLTLRSRIKMHSNWIFVPAFVFEALDSNFKIVEQPIIYYDRFGGRSKMRTLSYTKNLLQYALIYRLKKYGPLS